MDDQPVTMEQLSTPERDAHRLRNGLIWVAALLLLLLAIALAVPSLRDVVTRVTKANLLWLALGVALEIASCLGYVATVRLVLHRGPPKEVRRLAWAEMAFGAVVPIGGAGGLAVGAWAMRAWRIPWQRIVNRSAVIFLLTTAINAVVLGLSGIGFALGLGAGEKGIAYGLIPAAIAILGLSLFALLPLVARWAAVQERRGRRSQALARTADWVRDTAAIVRTRNWRLLGSISYLVCDIVVLWVCLRAVGSAPPFLAVVVAYQIGYLANLLPVPGGVGVLEGGLLGALLLYGLPAAPTAAAVVLYHTIALWIPAIGGTIAFARLRSVVANGGTAVASLQQRSRERDPALDDVAA